MRTMAIAGQLKRHGPIKPILYCRQSPTGGCAEKGVIFVVDITNTMPREGDDNGIRERKKRIGRVSWSR